MTNLSAFDIWWFKPIGWLGSHLYTVPISLGILFLFAYAANIQFLLTLIVIVSIPFVILSWFITARYSPREQFRRMNELDAYFSGRHNTWSIVGPQFKSMKRSWVLTTGGFGTYGTNLLGIEISGVIQPLAFEGVSGCTTWIKLNRNFPHTIIDSTKYSRRLRHARGANGAKLHEISLEGDFPATFKVYQEDDQQLLTLQILTPDRMAYLIDKLGDFDMEIHDNYLRLHSVNAQKSSMNFRAFLDAIEDLHDGFKVSKLNKI